MTIYILICTQCEIFPIVVLDANDMQYVMDHTDERIYRQTYH